MSEIRCWHIGEIGEIYVAHNEKELRDWYPTLVGAEQAESDLPAEFRELTDAEMDAEAEDPDTGEMFSWRKIASESVYIPNQIGTMYN